MKKEILEGNLSKHLKHATKEYCCQTMIIPNPSYEKSNIQKVDNKYRTIKNSKLGLEDENN